MSGEAMLVQTEPEATAGAPQTGSAQPKGNSLAMIAVLGGIALLSGLLIALVYQVTLPRIQYNQRMMLEAAIFQVLPEASARTTFLAAPDGTLTAVSSEDAQAPQGLTGTRMYAGYDDAGELVGVALEASGQGYQDVIRVIYGLSLEKQAIVGFKVLDSKETPGLGDKIIHDPEFLQNFEALAVRMNPERSGLANPIEAVKSGAKTSPWEIDGIAGATISSKAIGNMLNLSAQQWVPYLHEHHDALKGGAP